MCWEIRERFDAFSLRAGSAARDLHVIPVLRLSYVCSLFWGQFCSEFISSQVPWENIVFPLVSWPSATHTLHTPHSSSLVFTALKTPNCWSTFVHAVIEETQQITYINTRKNYRFINNFHMKYKIVCVFMANSLFVYYMDWALLT